MDNRYIFTGEELEAAEAAREARESEGRRKLQRRRAQKKYYEKQKRINAANRQSAITICISAAEVAVHRQILAEHGRKPTEFWREAIEWLKNSDR